MTMPGLAGGPSWRRGSSQPLLDDRVRGARATAPRLRRRPRSPARRPGGGGRGRRRGARRTPTAAGEHGRAAKRPTLLVRTLAAGAADPADPLCAAHLHCPPLAVAAAADLAASALNPSMDSWDQAPAASELEARVTRRSPHWSTPTCPPPTPWSPPAAPSPTNSPCCSRASARRAARACRWSAARTPTTPCPRAAWLLGLPRPVVLPAPAGTLDPAALDAALDRTAAARAAGRGRHRGHHRHRPHRPPPRDRRTCARPTAPSSTSTPPTAAPSSSATATAAKLDGLRPRRHRHPRPAQTRLAAGRRGTPRRPRPPATCARSHHQRRLPQRRRRHRSRPARPARPLPAHHPPPRHPQDRRHPAGPRPRRARPPSSTTSATTRRSWPTASTRTPASTLYAPPTISTVLFRPDRRRRRRTSPPCAATAHRGPRRPRPGPRRRPALAQGHPPQPPHPPRRPGRAPAAHRTRPEGTTAP